MSLDFGLFYEVMVPKPWEPRTERDKFRSVIEEAVLAEQVGFTHFWTVEHHYMEEYSHCSAPAVLYAAIAERTSTMRLGHGVRLLPFNYNHPVRAAEAAAVLDLISDGRVEFGTGRSGSREELEGFGIDPAATREEWEESLRIIVEAWTNETFQWDGPQLTIPPRTLVPKPLQDPHPPLWMACTSRDSHRICGERGLGLLSFTVLVGLKELGKRVALYREGLQQARPIGKVVNDRAATVAHVFCAETDERAREIFGDAAVWYVHKTLEGVARFVHWIEGRDIPHLEYWKRSLELDPADVDFDWLDERDMCVVGDPDTCREKVKKYQELGFDQFIGMFEGAGVAHEDVRRSIELFGNEVIPAFR